ncbi:MAG: M1 family metallopeptidase, partial [Bacteroidota bacterium]|nr:M1 family metallopeptidase [Bacteroidota bacterium]MDX5429805.1 M1 family metallopeptidase [Bacteroidota bacterium]MDX5468584.1 M1 family metallopeptidase [Bacteroidota bacterium]
EYFNHSPFSLNKVYYHLYFNAFQPNSEMDVRSRALPDPDKRVGSRIQELKPNEIGYHKVLTLTQDGKPVSYEVSGTILEVTLHHPIEPGKKSIFFMEFESQVPLQIRRSGRDNAEGIRFSMTQWYPKMAEFDGDGWHTDPYIAREFHGVWGDFKVNITMDSSYLIGATGLLKNAQSIGKGYEKEGSKVKRPEGSRLTWQFEAKNVHDFAWAADPDYVHIKQETPQGVTFHMIYQPDSITSENWPKLGDFMQQSLEIMNENFGVYPYPQYSFVQGGDGGMEYPMLTLITGRRNLGSLVGVSVHEMNHSWFQGVLAFDESRYYWMDEGFTEYSGDVVMSKLFPAYAKGAFYGAYTGYLSIAGTEKEQALSTHADWFNENRAYGIAAYNKGSVFLSQLRYIVGDEVFKRSMLDFYNAWNFKHPKAEDLKIIFELNSGLELDWYWEQWINTTHTINYAIRSASYINGILNVELENKGEIPMPLELMIQLADGSMKLVYIPVSLMRGKKEFNKPNTTLEDWRWVDTKYSFKLELDQEPVSIEIDPLRWLADTDRDDNTLKFSK